MIPDGGPAFPCFVMNPPTTGAPLGTHVPGMTLRDWFAGMALQGTLASLTAEDRGWLLAQNNNKPELVPDHVAVCCGKMADAMIEERRTK